MSFNIGGLVGGALNGLVGGNGGGQAGGTGGAGGAGNFESQIAELKRVSEEAQAKSIQMRMVSTQLASDKKVADERVQ
ncbi:hypothetical protein QO058_30435 (plasmid) [Bosea vestrisii]|uniref:hypothetical protein n=1 Tax=Bosea vestrisii TaxID=151416 RepID=UPI0024E03AF0|nr:hypothetical protein [Bosea vestrisii]WID99712.1 hypothetical protein QO058_30435 [Bosea vestrisii]